MQRAHSLLRFRAPRTALSFLVATSLLAVLGSACTVNVASTDPTSTDGPEAGAGAGAGSARDGEVSNDGGVGADGGTGLPQGAFVLDDQTPPLATDRPAFAGVEHPVKPSGLFAERKAPLPTNAFWENLALGTGEERINLLPYHVRGLATGLAVALPGVDVTAAGASTAVVTDVALGAAEAFSGRAVTAHDAVSATLTFSAAQGTLTTPLVAGMAYVTGRYRTLTPRLGSDRAILTVNGTDAGPWTGTRFELALNSGQTWIVYTSTSVTLQRSTGGLAATAPWTGDLRVAAVTSKDTVPLLDAHRGAIPLGGTTTTAVTEDKVQVRFDWTTTGDGEPLFFALPHQAARLSGGTPTALKVRTIKGEMVAVPGKRWEVTYAAPSVSFTAPRPIDAGRRADVARALDEDKTFVPDAKVVSEDPYFGGKQLAKLARLALVAEELGDTAAATALLDRLEPLVVAWLDGKNANALRYDTVWGGVVTSRGVANPGADFGQGYYNDHHFHYGYHAYAAAVLAKARPAFVKAHGAKVLWLVRDIANPSAKDPYFPKLRHYDAFAGHSWANGLFALGDNRNQESSSEAVNAWYAVALYGLASGQPAVHAIGKALLAQEIAAAQTYWQIRKDSAVYDAALRERRVLGNLWSTKVDYATFFGANPEYVFGIQMLPFTPISEALLAKEWVADAAPLLRTAAASASPSWGGLLSMARAVVDKETVWNEVRALSAFDDGNSRTNTLYWVATRP